MRKRIQVLSKAEAEYYDDDEYTGLIHTKAGVIHLENGFCHRLDGPAVIRWTNIKEYWLNDKQVTKEQYDFYLIY